MRCSLRDLRCSFIEMKRGADPEYLIPSLNGRRVYDTRYGWGKILKFFSFGKDKSSAVNAALKNIKNSFLFHVRSFDQHRIIYYKSVNKQLEGNPFSLKEREKAKAIMLRFCLYLKPFIKDAVKGEEISYLKPLQLNEKRLMQDLKTVFWVGKHFQRMMNLEWVCRMPIPLIPLLRLSRDQPLKAKEDRQIETWIKKIHLAQNEKIASFKGAVKNNAAHVNSLHKCIKGLIDLYNGSVPDKNNRADVGRTEHSLYHKGAFVFTQEDGKLTEWQSKLKPGSEVILKDKVYTIEKPLSKEGEIPRRFALKGHPELELIVEKNEAIGFIKDYQSNKHQYGIRRPQIFALEKEGKAYTQDRLYDYLFENEWKSEGYKFDPQDHFLANPIIDLLNGLKALPLTPAPLSAKHFAFNLNGHMRAQHLLERKRKSFETLQYLAYECSLDKEGVFHPAVYQHLMWEAKLFEMPQAKERMDIVRGALGELPPPQKKSELALHTSIVNLKQKLMEKGSEENVKQAILRTFINLPLVPDLEDFFYNACVEQLPKR